MIRIKENSNWLKKQSLLNPDNPAIRYRKKIITYRQLADEVNNYSKYFYRQGIRIDDNVGILIKSELEFIKSVLALWNLGAVPFPLNYNFTQKENSRLLFRGKCRFVLSEDKYKKNLDSEGILNIRLPLKEKKWPRFKLTQIVYTPGKTCVLIATSGTSEFPKIAELSFGNLFHSAKAADLIIKHKQSDVWLASLPFYHIGGFSIITRTILAGCSIVLPEFNTTSAVLNSIKKDYPTLISLVPTMLKRLLNENIPAPAGIRKVLLGGSPVKNEIFLKAMELGWKVIKVYGATETSSMVTALEGKEAYSKSKSSGKPVGKNKISIVIDSKKSLEKNREGKIVVHSKSVAKGYFNDIENTKNHFRNNKFITDDLGYIDNDGYLFVTSRHDDAIITGGVKVNPAEVEIAVLNHPSVSEAVVFGNSDEYWGEVVLCAVILKQNSRVSSAGLKKFLKNKITSHKIPKMFYFIKKLPKTELGKVKKSELRKFLKLD